MIKDRLVNLINEYVGEFVENINHDNLNYSVLKGKVELKDLVLKPSALVDFLTLQLGKEQAFEVKVGHLDYIRLSIPWGNLFGGTEVRLELDGLYVLLSPVSMDIYNKERVEELEQKLKQAMLKALDPSVIQKVSKEAEKHPGLFEKIGKYILNNIQIKISNVHVRYEDSVSNPGKPFAAGGILGGLYVFTTNDRWEEVELDSTAKILHKLGRVSDFSLYWNSKVSSSDLVGDTGLVQSGGWKNLLKQSIRSKMISAEKFSPVLTPFSAEAKVILYNIDDYKMPKIYIQLSVQDAEARMSKSQYVSATQWLEFSKRLEVNRRYRKFRPSSPVKRSVKAWWRYAYVSVLEHNIRPYTWPKIVQYKQEFEKYWKLYKKYLESDKDLNIKQRLEELEKSMDVTNILKARAQAKVKYAEETEKREKEKREEIRRKKEEKKNAGGGWFSWFWGRTDEEEALDDITAEEELFGLSEEEKKEIYEGVGYKEAENPQRMPKEYVAYKIQLEVQKICGCLTSTEAPGSPCILQVIMDEMRTSYENRPGGEGIRVVSNTESFVISGISLDNKQVKLLTSNGGIYTADLSGQMFFMEYELRPLHIKADQSLKLTVRPVEIFYDQHAIAEIFSFFQSSDHTQDMDMNALAMEKLSGVVKYSKDMLLYAIEQQSTFYISIHMRSPYIVIPENGTLHNGGHVLVVDFGTLSVESQLQDKPDDTRSSLPSTLLQNQMYDIFQVKVTEVKALIADSAEDWPQFQTKSNSRFHILPSTQLSISFHKTIVPDNYQIPHQKFDVQLPSLCLTLNDKQILVLYNFLFHFPSPFQVPPKLETSPDTGEPTPHRMVLSDVQLDPDIATLRAIRKSILRRTVARAHKTIKEEGGVSGSPALPHIQSVEELTTSEEELEDEDRQWKSDTNVRSVEDYLTDRVKMKMYLRLQVAEMVLQISQGESSEARDYLMFRLDRISADMALLNFVGDSEAPRQCGMAMFASVGALSLADKLHTGATGAYLELLRTESDKELITFSYRQISTDCPDFESVFDSTENKATLVCNSLTVRLDQIGMCFFKKFLEDLQNSISEVEKRRAGPVLDSVDAPQVPPNVRRRSRDTSSITSQRISQLAHRISAFVDEVDAEMSNVVPKQKNLVKFHLTSKVQKVTIHLSNLDNPLAEIEFTEMDSQISVEKKKACVRCQIKDLSVLDKTTGTLYPHILMLEETDSPFFYMKVEQFWHNAKKTRGRRGDKKLDYSVELGIGDLQLAYVNRFLWDITKFFEPLKTPEIVEVATATMENVTKQPLNDFGYRLMSAVTRDAYSSIALDFTSGVSTGPCSQFCIDLLILSLIFTF